MNCMNNYIITNPHEVELLLGGGNLSNYGNVIAVGLVALVRLAVSMKRRTYLQALFQRAGVHAEGFDNFLSDVVVSVGEESQQEQSLGVEGPSRHFRLFVLLGVHESVWTGSRNGDDGASRGEGKEEAGRGGKRG